MDIVDSTIQHLTESVNWGYYDKFEPILNKYMLDQGEGETKASQTVTAINKLVYKWYNDGDVFDNTYYLEGWANDLSSYANWLAENVEAAKAILDKIEDCKSNSEYEDLLKELADEFLIEEILTEFAQEAKVGSIYDCEGPYKFMDENYEEEEEDWYEEEEEEEDYE